MRVDSGTMIGAGHVVRCITLAEELRSRGARVVFVTRDHAGHRANDIERLGFEHVLLGTASVATTNPKTWFGTSGQVDGDDTAKILDELAPVAWLVVDHYAVDFEWLERTRPSVEHVLVIDDLADRPLRADLLLDPNFGADQRRATYQAGLAVQTLVGPDYALIGLPLRQARSSLERIPKIGHHLLISLGGSDPTDATSDVLAQMTPILAEFPSVDVVIGSAHPNPERVAASCSRHPNVELHIQTSRMSELLRRADVAIGAAGGSASERMCLGVPTFTIILAENQRPIAYALADAGLVTLAPDDWRSSRSLRASFLGFLHDEALRARQSIAGMRLIDGDGATRVVNAMLKS